MRGRPTHQPKPDPGEGRLRLSRRTDGIRTLAKVMLLLVTDLFSPLKILILSLVVLLGVFSAHLPDSVRKRYWPAGIGGA